MNRFRKRVALAAALLATVAVVLAGPALVRAATPPTEKPTTKVRTVTMKGEIVDPQCWIQHDGRGLAHAGCATACAKAGQTLAFLDDRTGTLYQLLAENHSANPNEKWYGIIGKPVIVKGDVMARGGMNAIVLHSAVVDRQAKPRP